jgi:hypothetical protein
MQLGTRRLNIVLSLALVSALGTPAVASTSAIENMQHDAESKRFSWCVIEYVDDATSTMAVDDDVVLVLNAPVGKLPAGSKQTVIAVVRECIANAKSEPRSEEQWPTIIDRFLQEHLAAITKSNNFVELRKLATVCRMVADGAAVGGDNDKPIYTGSWSGTITEFRKLCAQGEARAGEARPAFLARYRMLKNDKLARITADAGRYFTRSNRTGGPTSDLDELASGSVWFGKHYGLPCGTTIERLEFDRDQKLVKASRSQTYCGEPPPEAYK